MKLKKLNNILSKYQPTIQTIGIVLILITLFITIWQSYLTRTQLDLTSQDQVSELSPKFDVKITNLNEDIFTDNFKLVNNNNNHTLQNASIFALNMDELIELKFYEFEFDSRRLKNLIRNLSYNYVEDYDLSFGQFTLSKTKTNTLKFPFIIKFQYLENEQIKFYYQLFLYNYQIYFKDDIYLLKSIGLDYIKSIDSSLIQNSNIRTLLLDYSFKHSLPFQNEDYWKDLKMNLLRNDSINSKIYELIEINRPRIKYFTNLKLNDTIIIPSYYYIPRFIKDEKLGLERDSVLREIKKNYTLINREIYNHIKQMEDSIKIFGDMTELDSVITQNEDGAHIFKKYIQSWENLNSKLLELCLNSYNLN